jgi:hypothetical protein
MIAEMPARRVRHLRLTASDEALVRRGALLLEDALRTASLPGGDDGRLIVVRSLALGTIDSRGSSASVALALEQSWRRLAASAVHAEDSAAPHQPAVYFRDRAEALTLLAVRLASGRDTGAWFWPLAVPGWRPGIPAGDAFRLVLAAALDGSVPAAAMLGLVAALLDRGALSPLLAALHPGDGPALLAALGLTRPARPASGRAADFSLPPLTPAWTSILTRWVRVWGAQDARSAWLAALALIVDTPARLLDPEFVVRAERLAALVAQSEPAPPEAQTLAATPRETAPRAIPAAEREAATEDGPPQPPAADAQPDHAAARAPQPDTARGEFARPRPPAPAQIDAEQPAGDDQPAPAPAKTWSRTHGPAPGASYTRFAGLALALPLLSHLGIAGAIEADPKLADLDLPGRILTALARGARIPADDPIRAAFTRHGRLRAPCPYAAPAAWRSGLTKAGPLAVCGMIGRPAVRVLCEADGRLALALWHGEMPQVVAAALDDGTVSGAPLPQRSDVAVLVGAWQVAARRWLAAYTDVTLGGLIRRPGYIALTRTHLDVFFALRDADIRVRRAGLDLDPGWLPWYGRVVLFHYVNTPRDADRM